MKSRLIFLFLIASITACKKGMSNTAAVKAVDSVKTVTKPDSEAYYYLALGDSYTIGTAEPAAVSYPIQLEDYIENNGLSMPTPTIVATDGWTTDNLIQGIANSGITGKTYQVVTLLIGVNDQYEGLTQAHYRTNFITLLHTAITFAGGDSTRVFVLSIPDYGVTPFAMGRDSVIGPQIDQFNAINKQESINAGVNYLDITAISREAATDATLIAPDGLHPSGKMYALWIAQLGPMVLKRLQQK
jgi:lysophospholipase L1-like esterase